MSKSAPVVLQLSDTECGIASLAMIFAYYEVNIPLEELRDHCAVARDGCKAKTLIEVAAKYGFKADAYQVDIETVSTLTSPVIAHWNFSHYVVINHIKRNSVFINDPALGAISVSIDEFNRSFTGIIINITPNHGIQKRKAKQSIKRMLTYWLRGCYYELFFIIVCLFVGSASSYLNLGIYKIIIDQCVLSKNIDLLSTMLLLFSLLYITQLSASYMHKIMHFKLIIKSSMTQSSKMIHHILQLPMLFYSLRQRSEIISIASRAESIINLFVKSSINILVSAITVIICLTLMTIINYKLCFISSITTLIFILILLFISKLIYFHEKTCLRLSAGEYSHTIACVKNIETIKSCSLHDAAIEKWRSQFLKSVMARDKLNILNTIKSTATKLYNVCSIFIILLYGGSSIGNLMAYYALQLIFYSNLMAFIKALTDTLSSYTQHNRINDISLYKKDRRYTITQSEHTPVTTSNEAILCSNVTFYFNVHDKPTLQNINLKIKKRQHIAFVGHTGSGKSTLAKLLCALYQPNAGEVMVFGKAVSTYTASELARTCAYVSQDVSLFSGSLWQNLTLGCEKELDEIYAVIKIACLETLIAERGLYAAVEEEGRNFSGGEKQRIDIARALLQDTSILILDEATSALDLTTEASLINNLRKIDKTIIFVAHRMSSIKDCDQIFEFKNGEIIKHDNNSFQK